MALPKERLDKVGGSDIAAILGVSPWSTAWKVWRRITSGEHEDDSDAATRAGSRFEALLRDEYERRTGYTVISTPMIAHPKEPWAVASMDGAVWHEGRVRGVVEVKCPGLDQRGEWAADGTVLTDPEVAAEQRQIPAHYVLQAMWYMEIADAEWTDFVVGFRGGIDGVSEPVVVRLLRDRAQGAVLLDKITTWYNMHVERNNAPPVDGSDDCAAYLTRQHPGDPDAKRPATEREIELMARSVALREQIDALEAERAAVQNALREAVGDATAVWGGGYRLTLPAAKPSQRVAGLSKIAEVRPDLAAELHNAGLVSASVGNRTLTVKKEKSP